MAVESIYQKLQVLYPDYNTENLEKRIKLILKVFKEKAGILNLKTEVSEKDCFLITYGDSIYESGCNPLASLSSILENKITGLIPNIHILPFYPFSSDDGFSVIDYFNVDPKLGGWDDIKKLSENFSLMFDGVINHISAESNWFKSYLTGEQKYKNYFIEVDENEDLTMVTRPRALPLLSKMITSDGYKNIWTTFSSDQVDLNYQNPDLFIKILELILFYIEKGATFLRLDAIGFLWKKIGTNCIHLPETHLVIQLYRQLIEEVTNGFIFISETNVPHKDNISYFGNGYNEASLVYQFPLPPLILNALLSNNGDYLTNWAKELKTPSDKTGFFNFLASHDGIGLNPVRGIIPEDEILLMAEHVKMSGGLVSYKKNSDGTESPYELNISLFDAFSKTGETEDTLIKKFILAHALQFSMAGFPAIYIHSIFGSRNYTAGVEETGRNRTINREKLEKNNLLNELGDKSSRRSKVYEGLKTMIQVRTTNRAFHPNGKQEVFSTSSSIFSIIRTSPDGGEKVYCIYNLTAKSISVKSQFRENDYVDLFNNTLSSEIPKLEPYQYYWLKLKKKS